MSGPKNALAAWSQSALRPVELPTGMKALVVLPDVNALLKHEKLPDELRAIAMQFATTGVDVGKLDGPAIVEFVRFSYELVADGLKWLAPPDSEAWDKFRETGDSPAVEGWEPVRLTGHELQEMTVDQGDIAALVAIVGRQKTPNEVTIESRIDRGLMTRPKLEDDGERVGDYATFRGGTPSADAGVHGEDLREPPVGTGRRSGSGRGSRARRGARP
jgi:hypothetical protein